MTQWSNSCVQSKKKIQPWVSLEIHIITQYTLQLIDNVNISIFEQSMQQMQEEENDD